MMTLFIHLIYIKLLFTLSDLWNIANSSQKESLVDF